MARSAWSEGNWDFGFVGWKKRQEATGEGDLLSV